MTNSQRAQRVADALKVYAPASGDDLETQLTDALTDMMHTCDHSPMSFEAILETARMHYQAEVCPVR